ncbi:MAG: DUF2069 domain-containing protein [Rhodocyclaceae bacterium]|nr:DUF2069 domain-containing protein [Rhodocyclaceae bacterium]
MDSSRLAHKLNLAASASLVGLIALCVAWELWLAPLRPGGSWLVLKALPLMAPLFGILRGRRYTHQWASMLSLAYLMEGLVRVSTESGVPRFLAATEIALSLVFFSATIFYARTASGSSVRS